MGMRSGHMCAQERTTSDGALRIEPVDHWHEAWDAVRSLVERHGSAGELRVDADGWLSARQVLIIAFIDDEPAAHLAFSVQPIENGCIEARLDTFGIAPRF